MPDISYPAPYPFVDGTIVSGSGVQGLIFNGTNPSQSISVLNGALDESNIGTDNIGAEHTQRGSAIDGDQVAGNASLDYWNYLWADTDTSLWANIDRDLAKVVPGAALKFYMPWDGYVMLKWTMFWANTSSVDSQRSAMFLTVDGTYAPSQHRFVPRSINAGLNPPSHEGYRGSRVWSGHFFAAAAEGWHSAAMNVIADEDVEQTRVWARNMSVLRMKYP